MKKLKTDGQPLRSFDQIQKEIRAEQATIKGLEGTVEKASEEQAEAGAVQDSVAYEALAGKDAAAQEKLTAAEDRLGRAARRLESANKALAVARRKLESLEQEAPIAYRRESWEQARTVMERARVEAEDIHTCLWEFKGLLRGHADTLTEIRSLSYEAGRGDNVINKFTLTHLVRSLFNFYLASSFPTGVGVEFSKQFEQSYSEMMISAIGGVEREVQAHGEDLGVFIDGDAAQESATEAST